jgi:ABC-type multidrug transport system fused ATPase/permease subunit
VSERRQNNHQPPFNNKDDTAIVRAAEEANAHGFITDLSNGYDTLCGQRGGHLSG